jgi:YVTN family beta-propeller protein
VVDEDTPHHIRRDPKEMAAILPRHRDVTDQPQIHLVNQSRRLQRVVVAFLTEATGGALPQLTVHERQQLIASAKVPSPPRAKQPAGSAGSVGHVDFLSQLGEWGGILNPAVPAVKLYPSLPAATQIKNDAVSCRSSLLETGGKNMDMNARAALILLMGVFTFSPTGGVAVPSANDLNELSATNVVPTAGAAAQDIDDGRHGSVWVVNRDLGELAVFDAYTGGLIKAIPVGAGAHDICISERAGKAYITAEAIDTVTIVDMRTLTTEAVAVGPLPHHVEPSFDGRTVYVSLASHTTLVGKPQLAAIDVDTNNVSYITTSANSDARSHGPHPSFDGKEIYVAHDTGNEVTGIDALTHSIDFSIRGIPRAEEAVATRFGDVLWVSSRGDGTVKRIDLATKAVTHSVPVGVQPESVLLTPSERTLVVSLRGSPAALAFVDTDTLESFDPVQIGGPGTFGDLAVMTNDGQYVYATFDGGVTGTGGVAVVDVRTRDVVNGWAYPGQGRPHGIWYSRKKVRQ